MKIPTLLFPLLLLGCGGGADSDSGPVDPECGDLDGPGGETGDLPNILGGWTVTLGKWYFQESCGIEDALLKDWINGAMEIKGRVPDTIYAVFDDPDERFYGLEAADGGVVFSGRHFTDEYGDITVSIGGHLYSDVYRNKVVIEGFGFIGVDTTGDGEIDCPARGDFEAFKSSL